MKQYIWYKNGKEVKRSKDPEGKIITQKITGHNTYIGYAYSCGCLLCEVYYKDNKKHREGDKPAKIYYYEDGSISCEYYFKDGECHREGDKPAVIDYNTDGSVMGESYYKEGKKYKNTIMNLTGKKYKQ